MPSPDPTILAAAQAIHATEALAWLRWDQLDPECQAEYLARAEQAAADPMAT